MIEPQQRRWQSRLRSAALIAAPVAAVTTVAVVALPGVAEAHEFTAHAHLRTADGTRLGDVRFTVYRDKTVVQATLRLPPSAKGRDAFHGFHLHANNDPANGDGCVADPAKAPATWFVSADGHLSEKGQAHGSHQGDFSSLLVNADGTAELRFTTGRLELSDLSDRAVVVHTGPDNFGNVPVGTATDRYRPNSGAATTKTAATGNSGDRLACGVVTVDRR